MIGAALLASLMWGVADFLAGRASRVHPAAMVALVGQAIGLVALALILLIRGADADAVTPGIFVGLFGAVAVLSFYRALALGTMSIVAPIVATSAIVPVLAGVFDGERPETLQWIGIVAALAGVALASLEPGDQDPADARKALQLALIAALCIGLSLVFLDRAAEHDALTGANTAFAIATTSGLLSLAAVLGGLFPIVTVALAYLILHERLRPVQRAGVLLALAGIPLIST